MDGPGFLFVAVNNQSKTFTGCCYLATAGFMEETPLSNGIADFDHDAGDWRDPKNAGWHVIDFKSKSIA